MSISLLEVPNMIQIGSTGRNSGKTTLAKAIIAQLSDKYELYGLKIITITGARGVCQRGRVGCGICTSLDSGFELVEEINKKGSKDTMQMLAAGCRKVYLLKVFHGQLLVGFRAFLQKLPHQALVICESNSLREVVVPGLFIMLINQQRQKKTAAQVFKLADLFLTQAADMPLLLISNQKDTWKVSVKGGSE
ncbi:hypothetical protein ACSFB8_06135 [Enterococcus faecalis]